MLSLYRLLGATVISVLFWLISTTVYCLRLVAAVIQTYISKMTEEKKMQETNQRTGKKKVKRNKIKL